MSAGQLEVVIGIVHVRVALRTGIWQHALGVSAARRSQPLADLQSLVVVPSKADLRKASRTGFRR
jgi:hypothetical protein